MRDVMTDARKRLDESFHLVEHAVDDHRKFGEGIIRAPKREPLAQVTGDNALHPFVDLHDPLSGTRVQRHTHSNTKEKRGNQPECQRTANDACNLLDLIGISSDHQHRAIRQAARDQAGRLLQHSAASVDPMDHGILCRTVHLEIGWQPLHIAGDSVAARSKQTHQPDASRILPQPLIDRVAPLIGRQGQEAVHLQSDYTIGTDRQVMLGFQVDESEQCNGKRRKHARHQYCPPQRGRARELGPLHRSVSPNHHRGAPRSRYCSGIAARLGTKQAGLRRHVSTLRVRLARFRTDLAHPGAQLQVKPNLIKRKARSYGGCFGCGVGFGGPYLGFR
jgi:hypothetical protein